MNTIAYYISDYGFGHAARSVALIRRLLKMEEDLRIIICHSFALHFLRESLKDENRVTFRRMETDIGYELQKNSIEPDIQKLNAKYKQYLKKWSLFIAQEREFLQTNQVDLVISDITPFPFEAAYMLEIPSIGISNFTWYTAYQKLVDDTMLKALKDAYEKMTYFFSLAGSQEPNWGMRETKHFGFFARDVDNHEVNRIKKLVNPTGERFVVFFGLGMKIDVDQLERLPIWDSPNCTFIVSTNVRVKRPNVFPIPEDYIESQNYIAAADLVITKPGWGIVSEAVCGNKSLLILERQAAMAEDQHMISYLQKHRFCTTLGWNEIQDFEIGESFIDKMEKLKQNSIVVDDKDRIAKKILELLKKRNC